MDLEMDKIRVSLLPELGWAENAENAKSYAVALPLLDVLNLNQASCDHCLTASQSSTTTAFSFTHLFLPLGLSFTFFLFLALILLSVLCPPAVSTEDKKSD
jgi:hypothetical protein